MIDFIVGGMAGIAIIVIVYSILVLITNNT
jgi:hypothetical protein